MRTRIAFIGCFVIFLAAVLSACGGSSPKKPDLEGQKDALSMERPVYGLLEQVSGKYKFTKFSFHPSNLLVDPWVNLNNLKPSFDIKSITCRKVIGDAFIKSSEDQRCNIEVKFRKTDVSIASNVLRNTAGAILTLGLAAGGYYEKVFDQEAFDKAVAEAASDFNRNKFATDLAAYKSKEVEHIQDVRALVERKRQQISSLIKVSLLDKSGLYKEGVSQETISINSRDFSEKLDVSDSWDSFQELESKLNQVAIEAVGKINLSLSCKPINGWRYEVAGCNKTLALSDSFSQSEINVVYTILSQDQRHLILPITAQDDAIKIYLSKDGRSLYAENKSKSYISIKSASLYFLKDVSTIYELKVELAPMTTTEVLRMSGFSGFGRTEYKNVVRKDIDQQALVGIAAKYTVVDTNKDKTLFKTDTVRLLDLDYVN